MRMALEQAEQARRLGEVPVGCVIVKDGQVIGRGYNRRETDRTVLGHAELMAIRQAEQTIVLMDSSKTGIKSTYSICDLSEVDMIISDGMLPEELIRECERQGVTVI